MAQVSMVTVKVLSEMAPIFLKESLKRYGLTGANGDVGQMADILEDFFQKNYKKKELFRCPICRGNSDRTLPICPYCGASDEEKVESKKMAKEEVSTSLAVKSDDFDSLALPDGVSISELDAAIGRVQALKNEALSEYWKLGHAIRDIHERKLWLARPKDDDPKKAKYTSFNVFCAAELGFSHTTAFKMMDIVKAFSESDMRRLGASKLGLILQVPEEHRATLLASAETKGKRDLAKDVKDTKKKSGKSGKRSTGRKQTPGRVAKSTEPETLPEEVPQGLVVAFLKSGLEKLQMFKKAKGDVKEPATKLEDSPYCVLDTANGVRIVIGILVGKDGALMLNMKAMRMESSPIPQPQSTPAT